MNGDLLQNPIILLGLIAGGLYLAKIWNDDRKSNLPGGLPGRTATTWRAVSIAVVGSLLILAVEVIGESKLGLTDQQSKMTWLFALYSIISAPIIEELTFRGFLVVDNRGPSALWAGVIVASLAFAVVHPFLWSWDDTGFEFTFTGKGFFSTSALFLSSLWWYFARFAKWNPSHSLLPCFAAHAAKNAGVVIVKAGSGYMSGLW
ncbi:MAG: CPBP family intramembrane glutamic endopeptidase [Opitutaceae bacterium]